jgi:hypothetical protein
VIGASFVLHFFVEAPQRREMERVTERILALCVERIDDKHCAMKRRGDGRAAQNSRFRTTMTALTGKPRYVPPDECLDNSPYDPSMIGVSRCLLQWHRRILCDLNKIV